MKNNVPSASNDATSPGPSSVTRIVSIPDTRSAPCEPATNWLDRDPIVCYQIHYCMSEPKIGRALGASLHQAISEILPTRVEFYESWLTTDRLRDGELGRARVTAVISFLRQEVAAYDAVMDRAARYTADWTLDTLPALEHTLLRGMPRSLRVRAVLWVGARFIRGLHADGRLRWTLRRDAAVATIDRSLFCDIRAHTAGPSCGFYGALLARCLESFGIPCRAAPTRCCGTGDDVCEFVIQTAGAAGSVDALPPTAESGPSVL